MALLQSAFMLVLSFWSSITFAKGPKTGVILPHFGTEEQRYTTTTTEYARAASLQNVFHSRRLPI
jgi:hypothetical protein